MATLKLACYNMYGFENGYSTLKDLCDTYDIVGVEEHWLAPYNLVKLKNFHSHYDCLCWSAMTDKLQHGLTSGRPFGGIGVLFNRKLDLNVRVLGVLSNSRCAVLHCTFPTGYSLVIVVVYFPCSTSVDYECELSECLGFIEMCLNVEKYDDVVVMGDMNFECSLNNTGFRIFNDFCFETGLKRADSIC